MPDIFDDNGLILKTRTELVSDLETGYRRIYGQDINLDPDSTDGQLINIVAQTGVDVRELIARVRSSLNLYSATGSALDLIGAFSDTKRIQGKYSFVDVVVTRNSGLVGILRLRGENVDPNLAPWSRDNQEVFTVSDSLGQKFMLQQDQFILDSDPNPSTLRFQSEDQDKIVVTVGSLTNIDTPNPDVVSVSNPSIQVSVGNTEELDAKYRFRIERFTSTASGGYVYAMRNALDVLDNSNGSQVIENNTNATVDGVPAHSLHVIVGGSPTDLGVATTVRRHLSGGCGLKTGLGYKTYDVKEMDGVRVPTKTITWETSRPEPFYLLLEVESIDGSAINYDEIRSEISESLRLGNLSVGQKVTSYDVLSDSVRNNNSLSFNNVKFANFKDFTYAMRGLTDISDLGQYAITVVDFNMDVLYTGLFSSATAASHIQAAMIPTFAGTIVTGVPVSVSTANHLNIRIADSITDFGNIFFLINDATSTVTAATGINNSGEARNFVGGPQLVNIHEPTISSYTPFTDMNRIVFGTSGIGFFGLNNGLANIATTDFNSSSTNVTATITNVPLPLKLGVYLVGDTTTTPSTDDAIFDEKRVFTDNIFTIDGISQTYLTTNNFIEAHVYVVDIFNQITSKKIWEA